MSPSHHSQYRVPQGLPAPAVRGGNEEVGKAALLHERPGPVLIAHPGELASNEAGESSSVVRRRYGAKTPRRCRLVRFLQVAHETADKNNEMLEDLKATKHET